MTITSFSFFVFITVGAILYYLVPRNGQWIVLTILSVYFYFAAAIPKTIVYVAISTLIAYLWGIYIKKKDMSVRDCFTCRLFLHLSIFSNVTLWFVLKAQDIWSFIGYNILGLDFLSKADIQLIGAMGMGYYTCQITSYILDCYWNIAVPQRNPIKLFLFVAFFPQLTTGPISRYDQLQTLYEPHSFSYTNVTRGIQRILWGLVKKLVLAERVGIIVSALGGAETAVGFYAWIEILLYPIQMYADFSGCMDIVIGVSEIFDIRLSENFNNPFFSRTSQEFWQRWHITLGLWAKDYVLYPFLKSRFLLSIGKILKQIWGKSISKVVTSAIGMFVLWMVMGIWHGGLRYIVGVSLWYYIVLMIGQYLKPAFNKITDTFSIKKESFSWHLFQSIRTYIIYAIGACFFLHGTTGGGRFTV